jgi:transcriptional regulator with XRE-family HTH domain
MNTDSIDKIRRRIIELRTKNKYDQLDMSEKLNISKSAYFRLEKGVAKLTVSSLIAIAKAFNVSLSYLVKEDEDEGVECRNCLTYKQKEEDYKERINELKNDKKRLQERVDVLKNRLSS